MTSNLLLMTFFDEWGPSTERLWEKGTSKTHLVTLHENNTCKIDRKIDRERGGGERESGYRSFFFKLVKPE